MDEQELERMKNEAQKIVNEYQAKAQPAPSSEVPPAKMPEEEQSAAPHAADRARPKDSLIASLMKDKDRTIILALIILLMDEGGDHSLLLALLYLLM